jgi:3-dehydroquinate dehydratase-1
VLKSRTEPVQIGNVYVGGPGRPKVIVPITGQTSAEIGAQATAISQTTADIVEWRADHFEALFDHTAVADMVRAIKRVIDPKPLLFTVRTEEEFGQGKLNSGDLTAIYRPLLGLDILDAVDIEYLHPESPDLFEDARAVGVPIVGSHHIWLDADGSPSEVMQQNPTELYLAHLRYMQEFRADIAKLAVMPRDFRDVAALMTVTTQFTSIFEAPAITIAMGQLGHATRVFGSDFGSAATFAYVGEESAPGQLPLDRLLKIWDQLGNL